MQWPINVYDNNIINNRYRMMDEITRSHLWYKMVICIRFVMEMN